MTAPARFPALLYFVFAAASLPLLAQSDAPRRERPPIPGWPSAEERTRIGALSREDHADMMAQLGITTLRPGRNGSNEPGVSNPANYDEALANPYPDWPDALTLRNGHWITTAEQWWAHRRPEIVEDFEREVV